MAVVHLGTLGWEFPAWQQDYYPEDIPSDWKLAFYANDFSALVLPESFWQGERLQAVVEQLEDIDPGFSVYCLLQSELPESALLLAAKQSLADYFAGFIVMRSGLNSLPELVYDSDFIFPADSSVDSVNACYWSELPVNTDKKLCMLSLTGQSDLKSLRQMFSSVQPQLATDRDVLVMVNAEPDSSGPDISYLQQLRTLLELMAIA